MDSPKFDYLIKDENKFLDLMAYYLRANSGCISLACLKSDSKIEQIIIRSNSRANNLEKLRLINESITDIIKFIIDLLSSLKINRTINKEDNKKKFFDLIIKPKIENGQDLTDDNLIDLLKKTHSNENINENGENKISLQEIKNMFLDPTKIKKNFQICLDKIKLRWEVFLELVEKGCNQRFNMEDLNDLFKIDNQNINEQNDNNLNKKGIHSEILVSDDIYFYFEQETYSRYFPEKNNNQVYTYYIGCNFKSCPCCAYYMDIIYKKQGVILKINMSGQHDKFYQWPLPPRLTSLIDIDDTLSNLKHFSEILGIDINETDNDSDSSEIEFATESPEDEISRYQRLIIGKITEKVKKKNNGKLLPSIDWDN